MYVSIADLPQHSTARHATDYQAINIATHDDRFQGTGHFRFVVVPGSQPRLQQQFVNRTTGAVVWQTVPFVHRNRESSP